jgi:hypothetical protein
VIGDGVEAAGALQESEIMRYEAEAKKGGAEAAGQFTAGIEITGVGT